MERFDELTIIEAYLRNRKATRCPTAVAVPTQGAWVSSADLKAIVAHEESLEAKRKKVAKGRMAPSKLREHEEFVAFAVQIAPMIREIRQEGVSLAAVAATLNEKGTKSFRGGSWHSTNITTVLELADAAVEVAKSADKASE